MCMCGRKWFVLLLMHVHIRSVWFVVSLPAAHLLLSNHFHYPYTGVVSGEKRETKVIESRNT